MSNIIGDLLWNYITKPIQAIIDIPKTLIEWLAKGAVTEAKREIALKSIDEKQFKDPVIRDAVAKLKKEWQHSPEGGSDIARDLISIVSGRAALVQLEYIAGVAVKSDSPVTARMFDQIAIITDISVLSNTLKIIGSLIPTTNAQYMGIALDDYIASSGLTQITGFGYGMLFSNVVSPLVAYELNQKMRPNLIPSADAIRLQYRELLTDTQMKEIMSKQGFSDVYQTALYKGFEFWPGPLDFVRFAVRETFKPDIVAKYQYDAEFPSDIVPYAKKGGLSEEWLKHYWRAHWELPSVQMGYEMLHRDKITVDELKTLIAIADIAPWWRDKLIDISYSPFTRVDTRRLFVDGVITRDEVKRNYKDIGYNDEKAEKLTEWTCKGVSDVKKETVKDLTESKILKAYQTGKSNTEDTTAALKNMGYDDNEAALLLSLVDYQSDEDELDQEWKVLKAEYLAGIKDDVKAEALMTELKMPQKQQEIGRAHV